MKRRPPLLVLLCVLLCACDAAPSYVAPLSVDAAAATASVANLAVGAANTAQAASYSTQQAQHIAATQQAQATVDTLSLTPAAATAVMLRATQDSIVARSTSDAQSTATERALGVVRVEATRGALSIAATQEVTRAQDATTAAAMFGYLKVCFGVLLLVCFAAFSVLAYTVTQHWADRRKIESMLHTTPTGLYLVYVTNGQVVSRAIDTPNTPLDALSTLGSSPRALVAPSRTVLVRDSGASEHRIVEWPSPERDLAQRTSDAAKLSDVLLLLSDSMDATRPSGVKVPRFDKLSHFKTRPAVWGKLTDRLVACGLAEKRVGKPPKGGTFLTGGYTLYTLSAALQSGRVKLRPTSTTSLGGSTSGAVLENSANVVNIVS